MPGRTVRAKLDVTGHRDDVGECLLRAGRGDEAAFTRVYAAVAPRAYGLVLRVLGDLHQVEEVTQEAFVDMWVQSARFDPARGSAIGWALTIAHRRAVDRVRSSTASRRRDDWWHHAEQQDTRDITFVLAQARVDAVRVHGALTTLPALQRRAVELAYFDGNSHTEVARLMHAPLGTTKTRIRSALLRLRDELRDTAG